MKAGKWICCILLAVGVAAAQDGKKLSARELFYAETAPAAPKPAVKKAPKTAHKTVPAAPKTNQTPEPPPTTSPVPSQAAIIPAAYSPAKPLGLRYSFLRNAGGDDFREVDSDTVFHSGDRIRVAVESNSEGYLYIVIKGTSGSWKVLFPSTEIDGGSNQVTGGRQYLIPPPPGRFAFDQQAGEERLFIVLSRNPEPSLEQLIYSLGKPAQGKAPPTKTLVAANISVDDALVGRLRSHVYARDLVFEKVDDSTPGDKKEKAVYVVNPTGSAESRLVADVTLKHQ